MKLNDWLNQERGRSQALAEHLDVTPARVSQIAGDDKVPTKHMRAILQFTGGAVGLDDMVPDSTSIEAQP